MWGDILTEREAAVSAEAIESLKAAPWATRLVDTINNAGGLRKENMPLLFEARFAHELQQEGLKPLYEVNKGVAETTIDFVVPGQREWLFELVSVRPSEALKRATVETGPFTSLLLSSPHKDKPKPENEQSEEGEMLLVEQKIGAKVFDGKTPIKFPPAGEAVHVILVDMRAFLSGGDMWDYMQICWGPVPAIPRELVHCWIVKDKWEPIRGIFEKENPLKAAPYVQERIHFIGFVAEKDYRVGEIASRTALLPNPILFDRDEEKVKTVLATCPVKFGCASRLAI